MQLIYPCTKKKNNYDPFFESPDTPTQIGTALVQTKSLGFLTPIKAQAKIIDLRSKDAGLLNIEIVPCNGNYYKIFFQV